MGLRELVALSNLALSAASMGVYVLTLSSLALSAAIEYCTSGALDSSITASPKCACIGRFTEMLHADLWRRSHVLAAIVI